MFAYVRDVGQEKKEFINCDLLFELNKLQFKVFAPKDLKDFSMTTLYGRVVTGKDGVAWMEKCRIITLKETLEEFQKLQEQGKLPRSAVAKYEATLKSKELYSSFLRCEELENVKATNSKSQRKVKVLNAGLNKVYKQVLSGNLARSKVEDLLSEQNTVLSQASANIGLNIVQDSLAATEANIGTSIVPNSSATAEADIIDMNFMQDSLATADETLNGDNGDGEQLVEQSSPGGAASKVNETSILAAGSSHIRKDTALKPSSSESTNWLRQPFKISCTPSGSNESQRDPLYCDSKVVKLSEDVEALKATSKLMNEKLDRILELLVKGAQADTRIIHNAVTLDEGDDTTDEPNLIIPDGHVLLGGPRTVRRSWAEGIITSKNSTMQWKIKQLVEKIFEDELKKVPRPRYYLELPLKEADQTPEDKLFPDRCIEGLCNYINYVNESRAKSHFEKEKQQMMKMVKDDGLRQEKLDMLKASLLGTIECLTVVDVRRILTKVLYNLRPSRKVLHDAGEPPLKKACTEEAENN